MSRKGRKTKDRIFRAAVKVFAEKGYHEATAQEICHEAEVNMAAVNYHYAGKEKLYQAILSHLFDHFQTIDGPAHSAQRRGGSPEEQVRTYIQTFCYRTFGAGKDYDPGLGAILTKEMARPSPYLEPIVARFLAPETREFHNIIKEYLGPAVSDEVVRDCACSIIGQILYYHFVWPIFISVNPVHPGMQDTGVIDSLIEHVTFFSLAGLAAVRKALADGTHPSVSKPECS